MEQGVNAEQPQTGVTDVHQRLVAKRLRRLSETFRQCSYPALCLNE